MKATRNLMALIMLPVLFMTAQAQNDGGFIYGTVTTVDGNTYSGPMRWGKEEIYWSDIFNASKDKNEYIDELSERELDEIRDKQGSRYGNNVHWGNNWSWSWVSDNDFKHQFSCSFGEIRSLRVLSREIVEVELKNGKRVEVDGEGYNDIGAKIRLLDSEIGELAIEWRRIERVDFKATPQKLEEKFGEPLYGTVYTESGTFTGFVQWDHDERVSTDRLDGESEDSDLSIQFGKIALIERQGFRSRVVLKSGREFLMRGSNDVNNENRGIIVSSEEFGRVDIPWRAFEKVEFTKAKDSGKRYDDYSNARELKGTVTTKDGKNINGKIVFDLDESYAFELLQGKDDEIEYIIPFEKIEKIVPRNFNNAEVHLKSGRKIVLGDGQDVSDRNTGILVYQGSSNPEYISWDDLENVRIDH